MLIKICNLNYLLPLRFVTKTVPALTDDKTVGEEVGVNIAVTVILPR